MKTLLKTNDLTYEEWKAARRNYGGIIRIGGSDAPTIMHVNPFACEMDLWLDKTGQFDEELNSDAIKWGKLLEDLVAKQFAEETGLKVQRYNRILCHDTHEFMLANIDRKVVGEHTGLECKTTSAFNKWPWHGRIVPPYYYAQIQHYLAVTEWQKWWTAVLVGGQKLHVFEVYRDDDYIKELIEKEEKFWQLCNTMTPPEFDGSEASSNVVANMYPKADGSVKDLPEDAFDLVRQYDEADRAEKDAKTRKDEAANKLKGLLGDAERGLIFDRTVSWTNVSSNKFDSKRFQSEKEDLYKQYVKESSYRRFQIR